MNHPEQPLEASQNDDTRQRPTDDGYKSYDALWHLTRINLPSEDVTSSDAPPIQCTIAIIDNGAVVKHPYLRHSLQLKKAISFAAHPNGAFYASSADAGTHDLPAKLLQDLAIEEVHRNVIESVRKSLDGETVEPMGRQTEERLFMTHGTACAGLIAGKFTEPPVPKSNPGVSVEDIETEARIPYKGVDPNSKIVPIATSLEPDPKQLIKAVLYAYGIGADVILIPRGISTNWSKKNGKQRNSEDDGLEKPDLKPYWQALEAFLISVSRLIPIICAAGNSGESTLAYPASLAGKGGGANGVIAVGSLSYYNYRSSYSNYGEGLTVVAPSDDAEVLNRHQLRINLASRQSYFHDYRSMNTVPHIQYSYQAILALDVPGSPGYSGGSQAHPDDDHPANELFDSSIGSLALFGGTSAASAIASGAASLIVTKLKQNKQAADGPAIKNLLCRAAKMRSPAGDALKLDDMNGNLGELENDDRMRALFGAGLIDVQAALELCSSTNCSDKSPKTAKS